MLGVGVQLRPPRRPQPGTHGLRGLQVPAYRVAGHVQLLGNPPDRTARSFHLLKLLLTRVVEARLRRRSSDGVRALDRAIETWPMSLAHIVRQAGVGLHRNAPVPGSAGPGCQEGSARHWPPGGGRRRRCGCGRGGGVQHLLGAPFLGPVFCFKTIIPDSLEEHPLASSRAVPKAVLRWIRAKGIIPCGWHCFNPHPARRPDATSGGSRSPACRAMFQSSSGQKAGCNVEIIAVRHRAEVFQSSSGQKAGCNMTQTNHG